MPKYMGPFKIIARIGSWAYKLDLPTGMSRLHPVFHVGLLAPHYPRPDGAPSDPKIFEAVPQLADAAADAAVPRDLRFQQVLRHRDSELHGANVRDYLVTCRDGKVTTDKWFPDSALPEALVAEYWSALAQRQLAGVGGNPPVGGAPPPFPRPHQVVDGTGTSDPDAMRLGHADVLLSEGEE